MTAPDFSLEAERITETFRQLPLAASISLLNAMVMAAVLQTPPADPRAYAWALAVLLVTALRLWLRRRWLRRDPAAGLGHWPALALAGAASGGLLWGGGAVWLWPPTEPAQLFWVFLVGGMCIGAVSIHAAHWPCALAFLLPATLPLIGNFAAEGSARGAAGATMIAGFLAALMIISHRSSEAFANTVRMRLDLEAQARTLAAAEARLRDEVANREVTEASLRQAQKMEALGQLTGGIAHDFNNLLTAVQGSLMLLRKRLPAQDRRAARLLDNALQGAQRGAALTQRLLAFGRRQPLKPEVVELPALVEGMSALLRGSLGAGVRLEASFPPELPPVLADANQLELALLNLVVNARDAMPGGGTITIAAAAHPEAPPELAPGRYVALSVTDTGHGMDAATLAQAMEPFFTTKGVGKGTGLGLSMVHGLAAQSGGRLLLRSQPGVGTVAELWLPQAMAAAAPQRPPPAARPSAAARRIAVLLVDDDPLVLGSTADMLDDLGHAVFEAASGAEALARLREGVAVDLVITDYAMPGMTGLQLITELRREWPALPVMLATGYAELKTEDPTLVRLAKPFAQEALARAIGECL